MRSTSVSANHTNSFDHHLFVHNDLCHRPIFYKYISKGRAVIFFQVADPPTPLPTVLNSHSLNNYLYNNKDFKITNT